MSPDPSSESSGQKQELFAASRMKLQRAKQFIAELRAEFDRYAHDDPITPRWVTDQTGPSLQIEWKGIGLLAGTIVGDAIHNLRSALDLMASELARMNGRSDRDVYFPFSDRAETFEDAISRKRFDKAGDDAVKLLRTFEPYKGGNEDLRAIHDLDVQDKHTTVIVTTSTMAVKVVGAYDSETQNLHGMSVEADIQFHFPEGSALAGRDVVEALEQLVELVAGIIEAFASMVDLRGS